jgi:hypothetical protein
MLCATGRSRLGTRGIPRAKLIRSRSTRCSARRNTPVARNTCVQPAIIPDAGGSRGGRATTGIACSEHTHQPATRPLRQGSRPRIPRRLFRSLPSAARPFMPPRFGSSPGFDPLAHFVRPPGILGAQEQGSMRVPPRHATSSPCRFEEVSRTGPITQAYSTARRARGRDTSTAHGRRRPDGHQDHHMPMAPLSPFAHLGQRWRSGMMSSATIFHHDAQASWRSSPPRSQTASASTRTSSRRCEIGASSQRGSVGCHPRLLHGPKAPGEATALQRCHPRVPSRSSVAMPLPHGNRQSSSTARIHPHPQHTTIAAIADVTSVASDVMRTCPMRTPTLDEGIWPKGRMHQPN